jgi:hypothetical protein
MTNGSFEAPPIPNPSFRIFSSIPGWTATNGCGLELDHGVIGTPFDGQQFEELNSNCVGGVSQTVATTPGVRYQLSFAFGARPGTAASDNQMAVSVGGITIATIGPIAPSGSNINWTYYQYDVTATAASTTIVFTGTDPNAGSSEGSELDDVSLVSLDTDLTIGTNADVVANATSPSGATVTYSPPATSDTDDGTAPAPGCTPASGSTFPIGTTQVTCTVTDDDDTPPQAQSTFAVTVNGADHQLSDLCAAVVGVGPGTSLADKCADAQASLAAGQTSDTCETLAAFVNEVDAQSGKSIKPSDASALVAAAQQIQAVLACS